MARIFNEKIAKITPPTEIGLASNPNFVTFASKDSNIVKQKMKTIISVDADLGNSVQEKVHISITEKETTTKKQPKTYTFTGTYASEDTNDKTFLLVDGKKNKAENPVVSTIYNLIDCLLRNAYIRNNFDVIAPLDTQKSVQVIEIISKGYGIQYNFETTITYGDDAKKTDPEADSIYKFTPENSENTKSTSSDSIDSGSGEQQIELDIYADTRAFLGDYSGKDEVCETGTYIASLSKSYFGKPLWFDLNALIGKRSLYATDFLTQLEAEKDKKSWVDAGTMSDYRFVAKRTDKKVIEPFYFSDVLYSLNGYDYTLNEADMNAHVLKINQDFANDKFDIVKPLTTNLERTHVKGQRQYFNFILKDTDHNKSGAVPHQIGLIYRLYTQSGTFIGEKVDQKQESNVFNNVNTALLGLDQFLPAYNEKTVGRIDVALVASLDDAASGIRYENVVVSEPQTYRVLPTYLHKVNDFAFLNRLGGWDSFNFGGLSSTEFKTTASTVYKTLQPNFNLQTEIESVATKTTEEKRTVQTSPIPYHVVEWLREVSASTAVYELSSKRYIVVEEMTLKYNSKDDLFQVEMKYHYSDTFNTKIK